MSTLFYLPSTGAAPVSPAFGGAGTWGLTTGADRIAMVTARINSAMTSKTATDNSATNNIDCLARQYVSAPIVGDQRIEGTLLGQIRVSESSASANAHVQIKVFVVSGDGTLVRGIL